MLPETASPETIIVVPCYNEGARIDVREFRRFLGESSVNLLFVDDGSTDNTLEMLAEIRSGFEGCASVLESKPNRGKAEAVRLGVLAALDRKPEFIGYWDADLATPLDSIPELEAVLKEQPDLDMVFGCRVNLLGRHIERKPARHYLGRIFATAASTVLRLPIYDTQCGAKIFCVRPGTAELFSKPFGSRWVFDVELIARYIVQTGSAKEAARHIFEYPLQKWTDIAGSKVKPKHFLIAFRDMLRIRSRYGRLIRD